jgi:hypothetical protein
MRRNSQEQCQRTPTPSSGGTTIELRRIWKITYNSLPPGMEQPKEGPVHYHSSVSIIYKISSKYQNEPGREVPRCDSPVPQCAKSGVNKYWSSTTQAQIKQNAAIFSGKVPRRSECSSRSGARMRSGLPSRAWTHVWEGLGLQPTGGPTEKELRRKLKNCALREAASVKFASVKLLIKNVSFLCKSQEP